MTERHASCARRLAASVRRAHTLRVCAIACLALGGCAAAPSRPDPALVRAEALALLQTLNADLLSHDSATATLERWCADHRLGDPARIVAQRVPAAPKPLDAALRVRLDVAPDAALAFRHVRLVCGARVLSEADNWYVPARLTPDMNRRLDATDEPFGRVVKALGFRRQTLSAELLWSPLPPGWESAQGIRRETAAPRIPAALLRHTAVLYTSEQKPFSVVVETYTSAVLDFGVWAPLRDPR